MAPTGTIPTGLPTAAPSPWNDTRTAPVTFFDEFGIFVIFAFLGFCCMSGLVYICYSTSICELSCWSPESATRVHYEETYHAEADRATFRAVSKDGGGGIGAGAREANGNVGGNVGVFSQALQSVTKMCRAAAAEFTLVARDRDDVDHRHDIYERRILINKARQRLRQGNELPTYLQSGIGSLNSTIRTEGEATSNADSQTIPTALYMKQEGAADNAVLL